MGERLADPSQMDTPLNPGSDSRSRTYPPVGTVATISPSLTTPPGEENDDAKSTFPALKKRLPDIVATQGKEFRDNPKVQIARRTSPKEAKCTLVGIARLTKHDECVFTLYWRYYQGAWTVMRWEAGGDQIDQKRAGGYMLKLALEIDKATGKEAWE